MGGLIALSEIARNLVLPAIAVFGALIAWWQAKMGKRKNGFDLVVKAGELHSAENRDKRLVSYAVLLEAVANSDSRQMAIALFSSYVSRENELSILEELRDLTTEVPVLRRIELRIEALAGVGG